MKAEAGKNQALNQCMTDINYPPFFLLSHPLCLEEMGYHERLQYGLNSTTNFMDSSISLAATDQVQAFKQSISIGDVIITKMDGHPKDFYIYSMVFPSQCFKQ
jgi:hypothetical protein